MAGRASLVFLGQEDLALSANPQVTYFIEKYTGQTQFSSRTDKIQFVTGTINFGQDTLLTVPKSGDLITAMYLKIPSWPIPATVQVLDSVGNLMINYIELYIGSQLIERIYGEYMEIKLDLEVPIAKQAALTNLIGKSPPNASVQASTPASNYTIPLLFASLKKGLPICAFTEPLTFRIGFNPSIYFTTPQTAYNFPVTAYLHVEYTYLSDNEVQSIKSKPMLYPIEQVQREEFFAPVGTSNVQCILNFVNPVKEMFFVIQNDNAAGFDFSATANTWAQPNLAFGTADQLVQLVFIFNSTERISLDVGGPLFLSTIQALEFHTRNPTRVFYMYSFSLDPEGDNPAGAVNLSRIKNQILQLSLAKSYSNRYIRIYAKSYNFMLFDKGTMTLQFPNAEVS
jgi:hypothetical protein